MTVNARTSQHIPDQLEPVGSCRSAIVQGRFQLPRAYERIEYTLLQHLLCCFDSESLRNASGDVFCHIYECFLMKFARLKAPSFANQKLRSTSDLLPRLMNGERAA